MKILQDKNKKKIKLETVIEKIREQHINLFVEGEIELILNRTHSDDEGDNFTSPIKSELNEFLEKYDLNFEKLTNMNYQAEDEIEHSKFYRNKKKENNSKDNSSLYMISSCSSGKSDKSLRDRKTIKKNRIKNCFLSEKIEEINYYDKNNNKESDIYGNLNIINKINENNETNLTKRSALKFKIENNPILIDHKKEVIQDPELEKFCNKLDSKNYVIKNKNNKKHNKMFMKQKSKSVFFAEEKFPELKKKKTIIENSKNNNYIKKFSNNDRSDSVDEKTNETLKPTKTEIKRKKKEEQQHEGKKLKLDEKLLEILTQKVVILILLLLIMLPILGGEYVKTFIVDEDDTLIKNYCTNVIDILVEFSNNNSSMLPNLKRHIEICEKISIDTNDLDDFNSTEPYFLMFNLTEYYPYLELIKNYNNTKDIVYLPPLVYDVLSNKSNLNFWREGFDYFSDAVDDYSNPNIFNSTITFIINNHQFLVIDNILGILKSIFVGVVLVWGAYLFSSDVNEILIFPLDKLKAKINYLLNSGDEMYLRKEKLLEQENNVNLIIKNKVIDNSLEKNYQNSEMKLIGSSVDFLINLVSMSLGKNSNFFTIN